MSTTPPLAFPDDDAITVLYRAMVVSDVHAVGRDTRDSIHESTVVEPALEPDAHDPFGRLAELANKLPEPINSLVCCGDLTNRAGIDGYIYGISKLVLLAEKFDVESIFLTPGNHDVDVFDRHGFANPSVCRESAELPERFNPRPLTNHTLKKDLFEIFRPTGELTLVNLDTNGASPTETQGKYGVVEAATVRSIERALEATGLTSVMLFLCHHHPYRHGDIDLADYSALHGAPELFAMFERLPEAAWLLLHGHKHQPRLAYARGGAVAPAVFGAGSFSRSLDKYLQAVARNQCYLLEFVRDQRLPAGHPPVGRFRSLEWASSKWLPSPATMRSGLPFSGGFGAKKHPAVIATEMASLILQSPERRMRHKEVTAIQSEVNYLVPTDMQRVLDHLHDDHNIFASSQIHDPQPFEYGVMS